jgi:hypothetical protein
MEPPAAPVVETTANEFRFSSFCKVCEHIAYIVDPSRDKKPSKKQKELQLNSTILCPQFIAARVAGESLFPYFRLLMSQLDGSRKNFNLREKRLAEIYGAVFGIPKTSPDYEKLINFTDPLKVGNRSGRAYGSAAKRAAAGDFTTVLYDVLVDRATEDRWMVDESGKRVERPSTWKLKNVNDVRRRHVSVAPGQLWEGPHPILPPPRFVLLLLQWLDALYLAGEVTPRGDGDGGGDAARRRKDASAAATATREALFNRVVRELSPTEQKWLVRIILHDLHIGIKHERVGHVGGAEMEYWCLLGSCRPFV